MRVQRVLMPGSEEESWTLLGNDQVPVEPVERFLSYLASIEMSPNTVRAYAHDLKDWFAYLAIHDLGWQSVTVQDVGGFVAWLRLPPEAREGKVTVLPTVGCHCSAASVNRKLAALTSFCEFHARHGVALAGLLVTMQPGGRSGSATSYKPFLHHHLRDRLLFGLLLDCGVRIGEALGLRHEDMEIAGRAVTVTPRPNANRARAKAGISRAVPASAELMRLYADYLTREYGSLDSDYVFVNLWAGPHGRPLTYAAVYDLVLRLRRRTGIDFEPHQYRHTYATWLLRKGAGMEIVKELLGHASISTTIDTYGHLTVEDARRTLEAAGWFTGREVQL